MASLCWACETGVAPVGVTLSALPLGPQGTCWECHVFTCEAHARRDPGAGKWLCYTCVATGLAASAGIEEEEITGLRFESSFDFEDRFRELAEVTSDGRSFWRSGPGEGQLGGYLRSHPAVNLRDWSMAADAIGVGEFLAAGLRERPDRAVAGTRVLRSFLTLRLAALIEELDVG